MRILVAEDEPVEQILIKAALRRLGHECLGAADGREAWDYFRSHEIDVVISDWHMPRIDGPELCKLVRSSRDTATYTPFIFLTALDDKQRALAAMEAGADDYLVKPLDVEDLRARLIVAQRLKSIEGERERVLAEANRARAEAEAAVCTRDDVLAAVSHDLKMPLTVIQANAQLLSSALVQPNLDAQAKKLHHLADRIAVSAIRMNAWIEDLMDVTRLRIGEPVMLNPAPLNLVDLVQGAVEDHQMTTSRHRLVLQTEHRSLVGTWDETRLRRVLDNLLVNAIKYSPDGGTITLSLEELPAADAGMVVLRLQDEGVGIPADDLDTIFSRYTRAGNVGRIAGQGIGLAGVRQIVEQHGGSVSVESQTGRGSTFVVRLPLARAQALT
jgi:signal transduction histidine kinase